MEKNIKFDDIVAFIYTAMEKEYSINLDTQAIEICHEEKYIDVKGSKQMFDCFSFAWSVENNNLTICLDKYYPRPKDSVYYLIIKNPKDIARWNILIEDTKEYVFNKLEYRFNNFFNKMKHKPTNIDELEE